MRYRRRLRSRIVISFLLLGTLLTTLFAMAVLLLRSRLEEQLINNTLQREVANFVDFKRANPDVSARFAFSKEIFADVFGAVRELVNHVVRVVGGGLGVGGALAGFGFGIARGSIGLAFQVFGAQLGFAGLAQQQAGLALHVVQVDALLFQLTLNRVADLGATAAMPLPAAVGARPATPLTPLMMRPTAVVSR